MSSWRHRNGKYNSADIPSRGLNPVEISKCSLWMKVPMWLTKFMENSESVFDSTHMYLKNVLQKSELRKEQSA